jgi:hypothetical protein
VIVATTYDLGGWAPESRAVLATLARRRGIAVDCDGDHLVVPARDRHQLDDLIAYLNGAAAPGVTAAGPGPGAIGWGAETTGPPPAWHPDPEDAARWRWWDGHRWTSFTEPPPRRRCIRGSPLDGTWARPVGRRPTARYGVAAASRWWDSSPPSC